MKTSMTIGQYEENLISIRMNEKNISQRRATKELIVQGIKNHKEKKYKEEIMKQEIQRVIKNTATSHVESIASLASKCVLMLGRSVYIYVEALMDNSTENGERIKEIFSEAEKKSVSEINNMKGR